MKIINLTGRDVRIYSRKYVFREIGSHSLFISPDADIEEEYPSPPVNRRLASLPKMSLGIRFIVSRKEASEAQKSGRGVSDLLVPTTPVFSSAKSGELIGFLSLESPQ